MKKIRNYHFYLIILLHFAFASNVFSQNAKIDSLLLTLSLLEEDTTKVTVLNKLSWEFHRVNVEKCLLYGTDALELSVQLDYKKGKARALNLMAIAEVFNANLDTAIKYNVEALAIAEEIQNQFLISVCANDLGTLFSEKGANEEAFKYYQKALAIAEQTQDTLSLAITNSNIGLLHLDNRNYQKAEPYFHKAVSIGTLSGDPIVLSNAYSHLGKINELKKDYNVAVTFYEQALSIGKKNKHNMTIANSKMAIGYCNGKLGKKELAIKLLNEARTIASEMGDQQTLVKINLTLAKELTETKQYQKAITLVKEALSFNDKDNIHNQAWAQQLLSKSYSEIGDFEQAYKHQIKLGEINGSVYTTDKNKLIVELDAKYQSKKKDAENQLLKAQNAEGEMVLKQQNTITNAIAIILALVAILAFVLFKVNRDKQANNKRLELLVSERTKDLETSNKDLKKSNEELERFSYIASHDLKEPLRNIVSFTKLLERKLGANLEADTKEYISFIMNNATQMHHLIEDVLEYSRIDDQELLIEKVDVKKVIDNIESAIALTIKERNAIINKCELLPDSAVSRAHLYIVLKNLIENGIKYNESEVPTVSITCQEESGCHIFSVKDNGIGIDESYHERVFGMFKRLHSRDEYQGSGLGLAITKKIIEQLGGRIWINKNNKGGTEFLFTIGDNAITPTQKEKEKSLFHLN